MNKQARLLIADTFKAYPDAKELFANEFGQCFNAAADGLVKVTKKENETALAEIVKNETSNTAEDAK